MRIDWTTFALEIVNFLVLLWILRRFLFRPVREAIARRQAAVAAVLAQAQARADEAAALKSQYETRMQDWDQERERARAQLRDELTQERQRRLGELRDALAAERDRERALHERRRQAQARELDEEAATRATAFAARLLERLSAPELDARIAAVAAEDLATLPPEQRAAVADAVRSGAGIEIASAHALPAEAIAQLRAALETQLGTPAQLTQRIDPALGGGVRIALGAWVLEASLAHELAQFRHSLLHER